MAGGPSRTVSNGGVDHYGQGFGWQNASNVIVKMAIVLGFGGSVCHNHLKGFLFTAFKDCPAEPNEFRWVTAIGLIPVCCAVDTEDIHHSGLVYSSIGVCGIMGHYGMEGFPLPMGPFRDAILGWRIYARLDCSPW